MTLEELINKSNDLIRQDKDNLVAQIKSQGYDGSIAAIMQLVNDHGASLDDDEALLEQKIQEYKKLLEKRSEPVLKLTQAALTACLCQGEEVDDLDELLSDDMPSENSDASDDLDALLSDDAPSEEADLDALLADADDPAEATEEEGDDLEDLLADVAEPATESADGDDDLEALLNDEAAADADADAGDDLDALLADEGSAEGDDLDALLADEEAPAAEADDEPAAAEAADDFDALLSDGDEPASTEDIDALLNDDVAVEEPPAAAEAAESAVEAEETSVEEESPAEEETDEPAPAAEPELDESVPVEEVAETTETPEEPAGEEAEDVVDDLLDAVSDFSGDMEGLPDELDADISNHIDDLQAAIPSAAASSDAEMRISDEEVFEEKVLDSCYRLLVVIDGSEEVLLESDDKAEIASEYLAKLSEYNSSELCVVEVQHKELHMRRYESSEMPINLDIQF